MINLSSPKEGWSPKFPPDANRFQSGHPSRIATRAASPALSVLNITFVSAFALLFLPKNRIRFWIRMKKESGFLFPSFRARGVFLSPLRFSLPTTCDRLQGKLEFRSRTVNGSDCTIFGTHCLTGW